MPFNAGTIYGEAKLDTKGWDSGLSKMTGGVGKFVKGAAVAFAAGMTVAIAKANEFQKEMGNVATVIDTSVISTQDMTKALFTLDPALGTTTELTQGLYDAYSAGADTMEEAIKVTTDAATFAGAALTETSTAVDLLTTATNAYGKDVIDTTTASDIFFNTIKQGKITGQELASTIGQSIPLYASMGVELEELSGGLATMTQQGVSAAESTTQLNGLMNAFLKPSSEMSAALASVGYESGAAFIEAEGLTGALSFLEEATGGSKDELAAMLPETSALKAAMALTGTGGKQFANVMETMGTSAGATSEAFGKQEKTFETLTNQLDKGAIIIGNIGKYFVDDIAGGATTAASAITDFLVSNEGMEAAGNIAGAVAGTFEFLKVAVSPLVDLIGTQFKDALSEITTRLSGLAEKTGASVSVFDIFAYAIEGITVAHRVLGVAVDQTINNFSNLVTAVMASGQTVSSFFQFLTGKASWEEVKSNAGAAGEAFKEVASGVKSTFTELASEITDGAQGFTERAKYSATEYENTFKLAFNNTKATVEEHYDEMITGQENATDTIEANNDKLVDALAEDQGDLEAATEEGIKNLSSMWADYWEGSKFSWEGAYDAAIEATTYGLNAISALTSQNYTNEEAEAENAKNAKLDILEEEYNQGLMTEAAYEAAVAQVEADALAESNERAKDYFEAQKALRLAGVWIDAAASISGWWAQAPLLGPIAGPIFAGAMSATVAGVAAAQSSAIASEEFVPARATGGMAGGRTRVNELGGEIITLPDGSQVIPNDISQQIAADSGGGNIVNVNFYDTNINNDMDVETLAEEVSTILTKNLRRA